MRRYKTNYASGFSIAELLISMTIAMIIAVAMVPVVGMKKVRVPVNRMNHGIAECYYQPTAFDENRDATDWKLMYYYADTRDGSQPILEEAQNGVCTFKAPKAHYFQIFVIGAGGNGAYATEGKLPKLQRTGSATRSGSIRINDNFQNDIDSSANIARVAELPGRIRNAFDNWIHSSGADHVTAIYTVKSPLEQSGETICRPYVLNIDPVYGNPACRNSCTRSDGDRDGLVPENDYSRLSVCPGPYPKPGGGPWYSGKDALDSIVYNGSQMCWVYLHGVGNSSFPGRIAKDISVPIDSQSQISIKEGYDSAGFSVLTKGTNYSLSLGKAGTAQGYFSLDAILKRFNFIINMVPPNANPTCDYTNLDDFKCDNTVVNGYVNTAPNQAIEGGDSFGCTPATTPAVKGSVTYEKPAFLWRYIMRILDTEFYTKGSEGAVKSIVYENMTGEFNLRPAKTNMQDGAGLTVTEVTKTVGNGEERTVAYAWSGKNAEQRTKAVALNRADMPIIMDIYNEAVAGNGSLPQYVNYITNLISNNFQNGLRSICDGVNARHCPGFSGSSPYVYIDNINSEYKLTLTNRQTHEEYTEYGESWAVDESKRNKCLGGGTPTEYNTNAGEDFGTVKYCKDSKTRGNPGAVIIVW